MKVFSSAEDQKLDGVTRPTVEPVEDGANYSPDALALPRSEGLLTKTANDNCLKGVCCPKCHSLEPFLIDTVGPNPSGTEMMSQGSLMAAVAKGEVNVTTYSAIWYDEGSEDTAGDTEFAEQGQAKCLNCQHEGAFTDFAVAMPN